MIVERVNKQDCTLFFFIYIYNFYNLFMKIYIFLFLCYADIGCKKLHPHYNLPQIKKTIEVKL